MPHEILFCSGNANKIQEVRSILDGTVLVKSADLDLPEVQGSIEFISTEKCKRAAEIIQGPVLVEDTALGFKALKGLPGPYIKWFLADLGHEGLNRILAGYDDKSAEAICTFAFCEGPGREIHLFQGRTQGRVVPPRGPGSFGWDPIFEVDGETYAEMDKSKKNTISHRAKALTQLAEWLLKRKSLQNG